MRIRKRRTIRQALSDFRKCWGQLFLLSMAIRLSAIFVTLPILALMLRVSMAIRGEMTVSDAEVVGIFFQLPGVLVLLLLVLFGVGVAMIEQAGFLTIGYATVEGRRVHWWSALGYVRSKLRDVLHLGGHLLLRILLICAPFLLVMTLITRLLLGDRDIYDHLLNREPGSLLSVALLGILFLTMLFLLASRVVSWLLAIPAILFEELGPVAAINDSVEDSKHHRWQLARLLTLWCFLGSLLFVLCAYGLSRLTRLRVDALMEENELAQLPLVLGTTGGVALLLFALIAFVAAALFSLSAVHVYRHCSGPGELPRIEGEQPFAETVDQRIAGKGPLVGTVAGLVLSVALTHLITARIKNPADELAITAHRGASLVAPENTIGAIQAASIGGADFVELDVRLTKNREVVVFHDVAINIDADGHADFEHNIKWVDGDIVDSDTKQFLTRKKEWRIIHENDLDQIEGVNVGKWFVEKRAMDSFYRRETIPTLKSALEVCKEEELQVVIELKSHETAACLLLGEKVIEIVEKAGMKDEVVIMSFDAKVMKALHTDHPALDVGLLARTQPGGRLSRFEVDFFAVNRRGLRPLFFAQTRRKGFPLYVFTVNNPIQISVMISRGAAGVITDDPQLARNMLDLRSTLTPLERLLVGIGAEVGAFSIMK